MTYSNWYDGEPNNGRGRLTGQHDCVVLRRDHEWQWGDYPCNFQTHRYYYTCEYGKPANDVGIHFMQFDHRPANNV